jgi:hypothetical protein
VPPVAAKTLPKPSRKIRRQGGGPKGERKSGPKRKRRSATLGGLVRAGEAIVLTMISLATTRNPASSPLGS